MLDHIGIGVKDHGAARTFYSAALAPLGIGVEFEITAEQTGGAAATGMGSEGKPYFWFGEGPSSGPMHLAFTAQSRAQVDAFHKAALAAGARDNGGPGLRPWYHPDYYGAFVIDPDGVNLEAVCHRPE